jgi:hypothetical protein
MGLSSHTPSTAIDFAATMFALAPVNMKVRGPLKITVAAAKRFYSPTFDSRHWNHYHR